MLLLFVWVYLLVLIGYTFLLQRDPDTLIEGTELERDGQFFVNGPCVNGVVRLTHPE